ncbi:SagB family peptide dehydrogenase [Streptomyces sp. NPDC052301]|uniref:SagB family peptide dehydrogenase n=1 Tax=Streptomyces sp. NPDC052301 TaxID=3365687 RepID=UPI0037D85E73
MTPTEPVQPPAAHSALDALTDVSLNFRDGVTVQATSDTLTITSPYGGFTVRGAAPRTTAALQRLTGAPVPLAELLGDQPPGTDTALERLVVRFAHLLSRTLTDGERPLARIEALTRTTSYTPSALRDDATVRQSPFALLRTRAGELVMESPLTAHRVVLTDPAARALVTELSRPVAPRELTGHGLSAEAVHTLLAHLAGAGFVDVGHWDGREARFAADEDDVLRQWDFHDLLFHSRSRLGRHDEPFGGIFPYVGQIPPQPAVKPVPAGPAIELPRPSWDDVVAADPTFSVALEGRRSVRQYGAAPMTLTQLGEFLYRTARVRSAQDPLPEQGMPYEATSRPYPCGGSSYELELYLTVRRCEGLAEGVYYYDPAGHRLVLINDDAEDRQALLYMASLAAARVTVPDVLITMCSRFQRLSWKYRGIAYAVSLKHAGALYQTMYLVATAMGLAPCGLGSGDADLSGRVLGLDYLRESAVGEFMLGSLPEDAAAPRESDATRTPVNDHAWAAAAWAGLRGPQPS